MSSLPPLTRDQADALAEKVVGHCVDVGVLPDRGAEPAVSWADFHRFREHLRPRVHVPMTALTPVMARMLYMCGAIARPRRIAALGCYAGNLTMYLAAAGFGPRPCYQGQLTVGADVDGDALRLARRNFAAAGYANVRLREADAFDTTGVLPPDGPAGAEPLDALLIDIDDPVDRKSGYLRLLQAWLPRLAPGAMVIAHDVLHPKFTESLSGYLEFVNGPDFAGSTTLPVDECGVAISVLATTV